MGLGWAWTTNAENHSKELNNLHILLLSHLHIIVSIVPGCMNANVSPGVMILADFQKVICFGESTSLSFDCCVQKQISRVCAAG